MAWKPKAQALVTQAEVSRAKELLPPNPLWGVGVIVEDGHIQYRGAYHPNSSGSGTHPGVEVWTDIVSDQHGAKPMAENLGSSTLDEIETVLSAVEAVSNFPRDEVYSTIMIESGWKPHNYYHSPKVDMRTAASGLIGFMPPTLYTLGWDGPTLPDKKMWVMQGGKRVAVPAIDMREFRKLDTAQQAYWVAEYFRIGRQWKYPGDTYVATAAGGYTGRENDAVVYKNDPNKTADAWDLNKVWDINKDEQITVGELRQVLLTRMKKAPVGGTPIDPKDLPTEPEASPGVLLSREEWLSLLGLAALRDARERRFLIYLGPEAKSVMKAYQRQRHLDDDGIVGKDTLGDLLESEW